MVMVATVLALSIKQVDSEEHLLKRALWTTCSAPHLMTADNFGISATTTCGIILRDMRLANDHPGTLRHGVFCSYETTAQKGTLELGF